MANEYYGSATTPTEDFLAHYGIKGMKWGVRKAIADGNGRSLARKYRKAARHLERLNFKADSKKQMKVASDNDRIAKAGLKIGLAGIGVAAGSRGVVHILRNNFNKAYSDFYYPGWARDVGRRSEAFKNKNRELYDNLSTKRTILGKKYEDAQNNLIKYGNAAWRVNDVAERVGSIGLGVALGAKAASANAKWRATKGHSKMVNNRNIYKKEMKKAFAGTKYQNLPDYRKLEERTPIQKKFDQITTNMNNRYYSKSVSNKKKGRK